MTLKKSLISIVASAAIIATITGCSSDSTTAAAVVDTTTATSSVTAVDGYIINATATAVYFDDTNTSVPVSMTSTLATTDAVDSTLNTVGAADYTMSDTTNVDSVRYFTLANKLISTSGSTTTPATFIDDGSSTGVSDANDTSYATRFGAATILYAPAGSSVVTPISSVVFQQAGGTAAFTPAAMGDLNQTVIDNAYNTVAAKLGLTAATIKNIDPTNDVTATPEYALINTMIAQTISEGNIAAFTTALAAEDNATTATTLTQTITKLQTASTTAGDATNVFTAVLGDIALLGEAAYIADIPSLNLDDTLNNNGAAVYSSLSTTAVANVTGVTIDGLNAFTHVNAGDKIDNTSTRDIVITCSAPDANTSGTADLLVQVAGSKTGVASAAADSSEITIKVSDLNLSTTAAGAWVLNETAATRFSFGVRENNATGVYYTTVVDANASAAVIGDFIAQTSDTVNTISLQTLLDAVDANVTATVGSFDFTNISAVKVALVDGGLLQRVATVNGNTVKQTWGTTSVSGIAAPSDANLSGSGLTILNLATADMRDTRTALNVAPDNAFTIDGDVVDDNTTTYDVNVTANTAMDVNISAETVDTLEVNSTVTFTLGSGLTDVNLTSISSQLKATGTADYTGAVEANGTVDAFTTLTAIVTDEFGKSTTTVAGIMINATPSASDQNYTTDVNGTVVTIPVSNIMEMNNTTASIAKALITVTGNDANITDWNVTAGNLLLAIAADANATDINVSIPDPVQGDLNATINVVTKTY